MSKHGCILPAAAGNRSNRSVQNVSMEGLLPLMSRLSYVSWLTVYCRCCLVHPMFPGCILRFVLKSIFSFVDRFLQCLTPIKIEGVMELPQGITDTLLLYSSLCRLPSLTFGPVAACTYVYEICLLSDCFKKFVLKNEYNLEEVVTII